MTDAVEVTPLGVDSGGWPTGVAAGELVESAWGNAVVNGIAKVAVGAGYNTIGAHVQAAIGTVLHTAVAPVFPYATRMTVQATVGTSSDGSIIQGFKGAVITQVTGTSQPESQPTNTLGVGIWAYIPLVWSWVVPAGQSPQYSITMSWTGASGTLYTMCDTSWQRFRA